MLRIAHFSDLHYANDTLEEVDRCFAFGARSAVEQGANVAVITGDATDHALDAHAPSFTALARRVRELADHMPVLLLQGTFSHEPPGTLSIFRFLGGKFPVQVADRIGQVALRQDGTWQACAGWRFETLPSDIAGLFSTVPTVNKATVAAHVGALAADIAVGEQIGHLLRGFAPINQIARLANVPTVLLSHGTVSGCMTEHDVPMLGLDHEFTTSALFDAGASAVMLGHIHAHQVWQSGSRLIAYAGSIARLHYGEQGEKGYCLWEVDGESAHVQQFATPARRMVHFEFAGPPDLAVLEASQDIDGAFVRVRWTIPDEDRATISYKQIEQLLARAAGFKLEGRIVAVERSRAEGISSTPGIADKLRKWTEVTGTQSGPLLERLALLEQLIPKDIVAQVLAELSGTTGAASDASDAAAPEESRSEGARAVEDGL